MTLDNEQYQPGDLILYIEDTYSNCYEKQVGNLKVTLANVLTHVKIQNPKMFEEIMEYEMRIQDRIKVIEREAAKDNAKKHGLTYTYP